MLRGSYHVGVDGGLLDVTGDACHEGIAVLKVGVKVGLRVAKKSSVVMQALFCTCLGHLGLYILKYTEDLDQVCNMS